MGRRVALLVPVTVGTFRRHITVLGRASPGTVRAANQMRGPVNIATSPYRPHPIGAIRRPTGPAMGLQAGRRIGAAELRRRQSQKRRRDVLAFLLAGATATLALGAVPGLHRMLYANVIFDLLLAAYVALLVRMRNLAAERGSKLAYLPRVRPAPAGAVRRGTGRYASLGGRLDTGELMLGRAAN
jgi:hypothetical protein